MNPLVVLPTLNEAENLREIVAQIRRPRQEGLGRDNRTGVGHAQSGYEVIVQLDEDLSQSRSYRPVIAAALKRLRGVKVVNWDDGAGGFKCCLRLRRV
jgi:hypothetical protein